MSKHVLLAAVLAMTAPTAVNAVPITISSDNTHVMTLLTDASYGSLIIPTNILLQTGGTGNYAKAQINYSESGGVVTLSRATDLARERFIPPSVYANFGEATGYTFFSVGTDSTYTISGFLITDDVAIRGEAFLRARIFDSTALSLLYESAQFSKYTEDESFVLGGSGGDFSNFLTGSSTGTLLAGHIYALGFDMYTRSIHWSEPDAGQDRGSTAQGNITLTIGSVPEPATLALLGLALAGLGFSRRKKA